MFIASVILGSLPIVFGIVIAVLGGFVWWPWFFYAIGATIVLFISRRFMFGGIFFGISVILFLVAHTAEPEWLGAILALLE
jgi:hypothetical protein